MKNLIRPTFFCFAMILLISCQLEAQKETSRNITGFDELQVSSGIDVYLSQEGSESINIEADEDIMDDIIVEKNGSTLNLRVDNKVMNWFASNGPIKIYVGFKDLKSIKVGGGSDLYGEGALEFDKLEMSASGGSDIKLSLKANELKVHSSGGSDVKLEGYTSYFEGSASGGSDIKAQDLETEVAVINSSGGSDAHISVSRKLVANASGGSDVYYYGNPEDIESNESGGSDITRR